jgi:hypothetical protein
MAVGEFAPNGYPGHYGDLPQLNNNLSDEEGPGIAFGLLDAFKAGVVQSWFGDLPDPAADLAVFRCQKHPLSGKPGCLTTRLSLGSMASQ